MSTTKNVFIKLYCSLKKKIRKVQSFFTYKIDFESQNLPFLTNFTQLTARLKKLFDRQVAGLAPKGMFGGMYESVR